MKKFQRPRVVISKCIEFDSCRWNGVMISSPFVKNLIPHIEPVTVCPEVEIGLGVPRKSIRMVQGNGDTRLTQNETGIDVTERMNKFTSGFLDNLQSVDGFILKDRSPSCGYKDVKLYPSIGKVSPLSGKESGFFGAAVVERFPNLAVENEGRLNGFILREHFLTKLFALASWRELKNRPSMKALVEFHSRNKLLLMAYNQSVLREMGRVVANHDRMPLDAVVSLYEELFFRAFSKQARYTSNINVLMHALGYFSEELKSREKAFFLDTLELYRQGKTPLSVCVAIINSWMLRYENDYLESQTFFRPYPGELVEITDSGKGRGQ